VEGSGVPIAPFPNRRPLGWIGRRARDLRALAHYRPAQVLRRLGVICRRGIASAVPPAPRRRLAAFADSLPPVRPIERVEPLVAFALHPAVPLQSRSDDLLAGCFEFLGERRDLGVHPGTIAARRRRLTCGG
jgi:hypothetical protein